MAQLEPCCWKWHSSSNHRSRSSLAARRRSFFKLPLCLGVGPGNKRARFAPAESQLPEQALALTDAEAEPVSPGQMMAEELSVPEVLGVTDLAWRAAQVPAKGPKSSFVHGRRATRTGGLLETDETTPFETAHPVLDGPGTVPEEFRHFVTTFAGIYEQDPVEAMVISRVLGPEYLLLNSDLHDVCIFDLQLAHRPLLSARSITEKRYMRNYLCRCV